VLPKGDLFDRFNNTSDSLLHYNLYKGSDAQAVLPTIAAGGYLRFITGDAGTGFAADGSEAVAGIADLTYTAAGGTKLILNAGVKPVSVASVAMFVGFTDNNASLEMPIEAPSGSLVTNASNAVGWLLDTGLGDANGRLVGVNGDVDEAVQNSSLAFITTGFVNIRIEINAAGDATFYWNGTAVGSIMTTALATGVSLYPVVAFTSRTTTSKQLQLNNLYVRQD
jgi:hypothetical protein